MIEFEAELDLFKNEWKNFILSLRENTVHVEMSEKRSSVLKEYIEHIRVNNKNLLLEIDHVTQAYILSGNEKGYVRGYQEHLESLDADVDEIIANIEAKAIPYSSLSRRVNSVVNSLEDIEKNQIKIARLFQDSEMKKEQHKKLQNVLILNFVLSNVNVEKCNLPGLPKDYLVYSLGPEIECKIFSKSWDV